MKNLLTLILVFSTVVTYSQSANEVERGAKYTYRVEGFEQSSILNWEINGGKILSANPSPTDSVVVEWNEVGTRQLSVYEESIYNCIGETYSLDVEVVEEDKEIEFDIPNVLTPNDDGINDYFVIKASRKVDNYELSIMNRWGNELYKSSDISDSWNGKYNGKKCSSSTYFYILTYLQKGKEKNKKGCVQVFAER